MSSDTLKLDEDIRGRKEEGKPDEGKESGVQRERRYVGADRPRPEAPDKVTGKTLYIHDLTRPGMLWGKIKHSEHAHARIKSIDTSRAEALDGVRAVLTGYNTPEVRIGFLRDNFALKRDKVRQYRDEVAAVAAISPEIAQQAVDLIEVEYEPLPAVFDPVEALEPSAPLIHERDALGRPREDNVLAMECGHESGDLAAARERARWIAEGNYRVPVIQQACMGTAGCIAEFDARGNLTFTGKTQIPFLAQKDFNQALKAMGLIGNNARVVVPALGGAFGTGLDTHCYEYITILLAHRTGRPVKMLMSREEEFAYLSPRQSARVHIEQGIDEDGRLTHRKIHVLQDNGAYASWGATFPTVMLLPVTSLYKVPVVHYTSQCVYTNNTYCQAMRGYGNPEVTWAIECNLDELAEQSGLDALELRKRNCNEPGEVTPMGGKVTSCGLMECLEVTGKQLAWEEKRPASQAARASDSVRKRGVGLASLIHVGGSGRIYRSDASGIILKVDDFGNVNVSYGGVEMGQGLHAALSAAIADGLGVTPDKVFINATDTATCPWDVGTHASRGAFMACNAALLSIAKIRERLLAFCAEGFAELLRKNIQTLSKKDASFEPPTIDIDAACRPDNFDILDNQVFLRDQAHEPWARVELGKVLRAMHFRQGGDMLTEPAFYDPPSDLPDWRRGIGNMSATYTYGTQGVEIEVDTETGVVTILRMVSALDCGTVLNPKALQGQVIGGIAQGVGYALYEEVKMQEGRITNPSFTDYKIPTAHEMNFPIHLHYADTYDPEGPFGSKGAGEPGLVPTAPAIMNAITNACGIRIRSLPITPEKVLAALKQR